MVKLAYQGQKLLPIPKTKEKYLPKKINLATKDLVRIEKTFSRLISEKKDDGLGQEKTMDSNGLNLFFKDIGQIIDPVIKDFLSVYTDEKTRKIVACQIDVGGKRLRPALAVLSCLLCGGKIKDVLYPAVGLEIAHNYSLIIDDIIDNSNMRRGKLTAWAKYGESIANCIAIDYSAAIFQAANRSKKPIEISEIFAKTMKTAVDGEILDILLGQRSRKKELYVLENKYQNVTDKDYFEMVHKKTAAFLQTCCQVGGICADATDKEIEHLKNVGFNLGVAGQIKDDILDIFGEEEKFGKEIGKDIKEGKQGNIAILFALQEFSHRDKERFLNIMKKDRVSNSDIKTAISLIRKTNSYQKSLQKGREFVEKAKKELELLPKNKWNAFLRLFADFIIERER